MNSGSGQAATLPPMSVEQITRQAGEYEFDPLVPLRYWLRSAVSLIKEANIYEREGNDQQAYLLLFRHAQLVLVNLVRHPDAREANNRRALAEAKREVDKSLGRLEILKPRISKRYERYQQNIRERESWKKPTAQQEQISDPAIAGRVRPLSAADNRELAVRLAQHEFRRRAHAKGIPETVGLAPEDESQRLAEYWGQSDGVAHPVAGTGSDDLSRRLQEVRSRVDGRSPQNKRSVPDQQNREQRPPTTDGASRYKYPTIPGHSIFEPLHGPPPIPGKERDLGPVSPPPLLQPPELPAKTPDPTRNFSNIPSPAPPPIPSKISPIPSPSDNSQPITTTTPNTPDLKASTFTFKPSSYLENGTPLRTIFMSPDLRKHFLTLASPSTHRNLETCGILCGSLISNAFFISKLVIPEQESTPDTCEMINEAAIFDYCDSEDLMVLGWIHTHPSQTCFMSSRDLHTQSGYQVMLAESIAIVCAPSKTPDWGVFRLTDPPGLKTVLACTQPGLFHPHAETDIYTDALRPGHVFEAKGLEFETVDLRGGKK